MNEFQKETLIEETATGITDAVVKANFDYLKHGMKLGVRLLFELYAFDKIVRHTYTTRVLQLEIV